MPRFAVGQTVETREPTIAVDAGLAIGLHRFQLLVIDDAGNRSRPDIKTVAIQREVVDPPAPPRVSDPNQPQVTASRNAVAGPLEATSAPAVRPTKPAAAVRKTRVKRRTRAKPKAPARRPRRKE